MAQRTARKTKIPVLLLRAAFAVLLVSMMAAYLSDLVTISAKKQELETVQTQLEQQNTANQELQRVLEGDEDEILERVARDSYGYAAPNERIFKDVTGK